MKTFQPVARVNDTHQNGEKDSPEVLMTQRKEYPGKTSFPLAPSGEVQDVLQPTIQLKAEETGVVQFTIDSAAQELFERGCITVKRSDLKGTFNKTHGVTAANLKDIQSKLSELRENAPKTTQSTTVDMTDSSNWPTSGGMDETDAKTVAGTLDWVEDTTNWTCQDKSHTPKGKVYTNGAGAYYGADNTGHVGWGFKVWEVNKGKELKYRGNVTWNGTDWVYRARGTK
jgi:hypothetical protein